MLGMYFKYCQAFSHLLSFTNLEPCQELMEYVHKFLLDLFKMGVFAYFCLILLHKEKFCVVLSFNSIY